VAQRRFCIGKLITKRHASARAALTPSHTGRMGPRVGTYITCDAAVVVQVSVDVPVVVPALSAMDVGLNEHTGESTAPAGPAILELSATLPANPPLPVAVTVVEAGDPGATLIAVGFALTLNPAALAHPLRVPVIVNAAVVEVAVGMKLASPEYVAVKE